MTGREERIGREVLALWRELYGEPPPARADGGQLLDLILRRMPDVDYEKLASPHLRARNFTWARPASGGC